MVNAWYINEENDLCIKKGHLPQYISQDVLYNSTGVEYFKLDVNTYSEDGILDRIKEERGYIYEDEMECSKNCRDFEEKLKTFATEHLHSDEEIRFFLDGSGYFDVRDNSDRWIRIQVRAGDMIVLPQGIYHRFTLGAENFVKMKRLFSEIPAWKAYNRPADDLACRTQYVERLKNGFAVVN